MIEDKAWELVEDFSDDKAPIKQWNLESLDTAVRQLFNFFSVY